MPAVLLGLAGSAHESTTWEKIECPSSGCENPMSHKDVKTHAPEDVFARFDELSMRSTLSAETNFRYCMAEGCVSGQIHDEGVEANIFNCGACGFRVCTVHNMPSMPARLVSNMTSAKNLERKPVVAPSAAKKQRVWQRFNAVLSFVLDAARRFRRPLDATTCHVSLLGLTVLLRLLMLM